MRQAPPLNLLVAYYLATPAFAAADLLWGVNVRAAALDGAPSLKLGYYGLCCGCAGIALWRPRAVPAMAVLESAANILTLILGILLPIFRLPDLLLSGANVANPITPELVTNFILAGGVGALAFYRSLWSLQNAGE